MKVFFTLTSVFCFIFCLPQSQMTVQEIDNKNLSLKNIEFDNEGKNLTTICVEVYRNAKNIDYKKGQIDALLKSNEYRINSRSDVSLILSDTKEIENLAISVSDYYSLGMAKLQRSAVFVSLGLYSQAKSNLQNIFRYVPLVKYDEQRENINVNAYFILASIYNEYQDNDKCIYYYKKMFAEASKMAATNPKKAGWIINASNCLAQSYTNERQYKEAKYYLRIQERYLKKNNNKFYLAMFHGTKGHFLVTFRNEGSKKDNLDSATYHLKKAESYAKEIDNKLLLKQIYRDLATVFAEKKDYHNQVDYLEKTLAVTDNLDVIRNKNLQKIDLKITDKIPTDENQDYQNHLIIFCIIVLVIVCFLIVWRTIYCNDSRPILNKKPSNQLLDAPIDTAKLSLKELLDLGVRNDPSFYLQFMNTFPEFDKKLLNINPTIKVSDIEYCALIKLNLDTKQIATIKKMSVGAVEAKKYRIRKKLNISYNENMSVVLSQY